MIKIPPAPPTIPATPRARDRKKDASLADLRPPASAEERAAYDSFVAAAYAQARTACEAGSPLAIAVRAALRALRERRRIFGSRPDEA